MTCPLYGKKKLHSLDPLSGHGLSAYFEDEGHAAGHMTVYTWLTDTLQK
jgi:hypothetical protein